MNIRKSTRSDTLQAESRDVSVYELRHFAKDMLMDIDVEATICAITETHTAKGARTPRFPCGQVAA